MSAPWLEHDLLHALRGAKFLDLAESDDHRRQRIAAAGRRRSSDRYRMKMVARGGLLACGDFPPTPEDIDTGRDPITLRMSPHDDVSRERDDEPGSLFDRRRR